MLLNKLYITKTIAVTTSCLLLFGGLIRSLDEPNFRWDRFLKKTGSKAAPNNFFKADPSPERIAEFQVGFMILLIKALIFLLNLQGEILI